jgi:hypothetical protein
MPALGSRLPTFRSYLSRQRPNHDADRAMGNLTLQGRRLPTHALASYYTAAQPMAEDAELAIWPVENRL